ncbi:LPXTG cell wall anchor domain-containing protein [Arthrobacter sp. GAS37]|uniref:LPXTG cell wall anchor domain-containing protein n=1 Tax=Arthrobacter sp. GAS37 TaxID=3156261 RepID=UPI00384ACA82
MAVSVPGFFRSAGAVVLGMLVAGVFVLGIGGPARAETAYAGPTRTVATVHALATVQAAPRLSPATTAGACPAQADPSKCDADGDGIPDWVELKVCGTATCTTGLEDTNHNKIPDWLEVEACGTTTCVTDPGADANGNGIPDWVEQVLCGSTTCATGHEDADGNGIPDWTEIVICGKPGCSTGKEDYNHNGVPDWKELAACLKEPTQGGPASSGTASGTRAGATADLVSDPVGVFTRGTVYWFDVFTAGGGVPQDASAGEVAGWAWLVAIGLALAGLLFLILWRRRRRKDEDPDDEDPDDDSPDGNGSDDATHDGEGTEAAPAGLAGLLGGKDHEDKYDGEANHSGEGVQI